MKPEDYKKAAIRTENTPNFICKNREEAGAIEPAGYIHPPAVAADQRLSRIMHAILGMITELGELCDPVKRHLVYDAELDVCSNEKGSVREEMGDRAWYDALFLDAIDAKLEDIWERNISKLRVRFPDKFTNEQAITRDLDAEQNALAAKPMHSPDQRNAMMQEICALKPATNENDARVIFEWRRVFERVGGQLALEFFQPNHIMDAMTTVAHRLGIDAPRVIVSSSNARIAAMCVRDIDALKQETFDLRERLAKIQVGLQTLSMG